MPGSLDQALDEPQERPRVPAEGRRLHARTSSRPGSSTSGRTRSTRCGCARIRTSSLSTTTPDRRESAKLEGPACSDGRPFVFSGLGVGVEERVRDQDDDADGDEHVGDVEGRPMVAAPMQVEEVGDHGRAAAGRRSCRARRRELRRARRAAGADRPAPARGSRRGRRARPRTARRKNGMRTASFASAKQLKAPPGVADVSDVRRSDGDHRNRSCSATASRITYLVPGRAASTAPATTTTKATLISWDRERLPRDRAGTAAAQRRGASASLPTSSR